MNHRMYRYHGIWLLAALAFLMTLALAAAESSAPGPAGQSPLSPLAAFPWVSPPGSASPWDRLFSDAYWTSPLPWVAVGLVLFSALAAVLVRVLRPARPTRVKRAERAGPPQQAP